MCGIIGIIGKAPVTPLLVDALKRLEYRGYDSAGVATLVNGHIERRRAEGKLVSLSAALGQITRSLPLLTCGISGGVPADAACVRPATRSVRFGPVPL